jgi:muramoyltetrapeptide carboxypeptidase
MILKPERLKTGDVIGVVAPASPVEKEDKIERATRYLERLGFRVTFGKHVHNVHGYLAGTDKERAEDINRMFRDPQVKALFALRGGYGSPRILRLIDYKQIARHPKIFVGYSDITALSSAIFAKTGLITFSGPMVASDMSKPDKYSQDIFWRMLTEKGVFGAIENHEDYARKPLRNGSAIGRLIGGNLSLLTVLIGTEFLPSMKNALFFTEDVGEEPYRVDRMLSQLHNARLLESLSGIVFGQFTNASPEDKPSLTMDEVFAHYILALRKGRPVMQGLSYGHVRHKHIIPFGAKARLTVQDDKCALELLETVIT